MSYRAWFQCINPQCGATYPLNSIVYQCQQCHSLLEVQHDMAALARRGAAAWMKLFEDRYKSNEWPYGSGVWGKKEWILPQISDDNVVSLYEGGTNLFWAERFGKVIGVDDLWIKLCGNTHSGSFKDLGMTVLVSQVKQMISEGAPIKAVACASTGDTSAALATYCAAAGIQSVVLLPRGKISIAQLIQPVSNDALVLYLDTDFDGCMKLVQEITKDPTLYLANSMNSLRVEGQKTVGIEIVQQFDWEVPDVIIIPGGNLGNVSALGKGLLMMKDLGLIAKLPRIVVAQAQRANPLYRSYLRNFESFEPIQAAEDAGERDPDRQPGQLREGRPHPQAVQRHRRAGDRGRAGGCGGAGRPHGDVQLPAHGRGAGGADQAAQGRQDRQVRARGGDLDGARAEVRRDEGEVSPARAGVPEPAREPADRAARAAGRREGSAAEGARRPNASSEL